MGIGMRGRGVIAALLVGVMSASLVLAQELNFELTDTGVLKHSEYGTGIEMRITPNAMPSADILDDVMRDLCNHFAPSVIPFVASQTGVSAPEFLSVRLTTTGGIFGRYATEFFRVDGDSCGDTF